MPAKKHSKVIKSASKKAAPAKKSLKTVKRVVAARSRRSSENSSECNCNNMWGIRPTLVWLFVLSLATLACVLYIQQTLG